MGAWIWEHKNWPKFHWDLEVLTPDLTQARHSQGKLLGIIQTINKDVTEEVDCLVLTEQAMETSAIEGEHLNRDSVRSSIANRLGLSQAGISRPPDRYVEGLLDMLLDATQNFHKPLVLERLYGWHAALFPTGYSGIAKITIANLREPGPMQIVSGRPGKITVHYEAPPAKQLPKEMEQFLSWFNDENEIDGLLRAGSAHLWFELLHPFEDGNGRIGRAIIDLALAQDEQLTTRYYSLSSAIMNNRKEYYSALGNSCCDHLDITQWLSWFLKCTTRAIEHSIDLINNINTKSRFWEYHAKTAINTRQIKVLNRLLNAGENGFTGGMTTRKYMHLTRTSRATAYRELRDLVDKHCLQTSAAKGRSAFYEINWAVVKES